MPGCRLQSRLKKGRTFQEQPCPRIGPEKEESQVT